MNKTMNITCEHNEMISTPNPNSDWQCADCGYVYGKTERVVQPTPRPWHMDRDGAIAGDYRRLFFVETTYLDNGKDEAAANAELVIRAVNNFDALVAALEDELEALRVWLSNQTNAKPEVIEGMLISRQKIADALRQARQAS